MPGCKTGMLQIEDWLCKSISCQSLFRVLRWRWVSSHHIGTECVLPFCPKLILHYFYLLKLLKLYMMSTLRCYWRDVNNNDWSLGSQFPVSLRHGSWRQTGKVFMRAGKFCVLLDRASPATSFVSLSLSFLHVTYCLNMYDYIYFFCSLLVSGVGSPVQCSWWKSTTSHGWHIVSMLSASQSSILLVRWSVFGYHPVDTACFLAVAYWACWLWFPGGPIWRCLKNLFIQPRHDYVTRPFVAYFLSEYCWKLTPSSIK